MTFIDHSVHPELDDPPTSFDTVFDKAWKEVFDEFPVPTSSGYHAFRAWLRWEPLATPPGILPSEPHYLRMDQLEERDPDPLRNQDLTLLNSPLRSMQ